MKLKFTFLPLLAVLTLAVSCSNEPTAPARFVALSVTLNRLDQVQASLLGASQNEIYYRVDGQGSAQSHFTAGPFSMPVSSGSITFTAQVPRGGAGPQVLTLQLNDASDHAPLAVGATGFDFGVSLAAGLSVDMGSVTRTCYFVNTANTPNYASGYSFAFETDAVNPPAGAVTDLVVSVCAACAPGNFYFQGPVNTSLPTPVTIGDIAYLGNGDLVDFDSVPPASAFLTTSLAAKGGNATLAAGDIYCIQLQNPPGAHAWVQVTNPGNFVSTGGGYGPAFVYRVNSTLPYYAYEQTTADIQGSCTSY